MHPFHVTAAQSFAWLFALAAIAASDCHSGCSFHSPRFLRESHTNSVPCVAVQAFIAAAAASGEMQASKIGAGNAGSNADNEYNSRCVCSPFYWQGPATRCNGGSQLLVHDLLACRRTSTSLLLTPEVLVRITEGCGGG